ncbi:MAG: hypothetical protein IPJ11_09740 [Gemmatimonadetes bacterium]|nr:hypothetical protein [Gemmatimonadota bacterium]
MARHAAALGAWVRSRGGTSVVIGRDARTSAPMFAAGCDGRFPLAWTHRRDRSRRGAHADGADGGGASSRRRGLILTRATIRSRVECAEVRRSGRIFLDAESGAMVRRLADEGRRGAGRDTIGTRRDDPDAVERHLDAILALPEIDVEAIRAAKFHVALDCVRRGDAVDAGAVRPPRCPGQRDQPRVRRSLPRRALRRRSPREPRRIGRAGPGLRCRPRDGGRSCDDRLALVDESGTPIGEDYTPAVATRAVLARQPAGSGPQTVVVNLSTSLVVEDAARSGGARSVRAPVGRAPMWARAIVAERAVIGDGNGGVILPALHVGGIPRWGGPHLANTWRDRGNSSGPWCVPPPGTSSSRRRHPRGGDLVAQYAALRLQWPDAEADDRDGLRLAWSDRWLPSVLGNRNR